MDLIGLTIIITVPCFFIKSFWDLLTGKTKPQERPKKLSKKEQALQERRKELLHDNCERAQNAFLNIYRLKREYAISFSEADIAHEQVEHYEKECDKLIWNGDFEEYERRALTYPYLSKDNGETEAACYIQ